MLDPLAPSAPVATCARAALRDTGAPPGLFDALDLAREHYLDAARASEDPRARATYRSRANQIGLVKILIRVVLSEYPRCTYSKRMRRDLVVAALELHRFHVWAVAIRTGNYTNVVA